MEFKPQCITHKIVCVDTLNDWGVVIEYKDGNNEHSAAMLIHPDCKWSKITNDFIPWLEGIVQCKVEEIEPIT